MIRLPRYAVQGGTAVVTGAAGGIGEALATELAARGSHLVLLDRDADRLAGVASSLRRAHPTLQVRTHVVDLADAAATARAADAVLAASPRVTLLSTTPAWRSSAGSIRWASRSSGGSWR